MATYTLEYRDTAYVDYGRLIFDSGNVGIGTSTTTATPCGITWTTATAQNSIWLDTVQEYCFYPADPEADKRSEELLLDSLDEVQRLMYEKAKKFLVRGGETGREYEIHRGRTKNVVFKDENGTEKRLCAHPKDSVPDCDTVLAQKLMLETCEREFLGIANVY